MCFEVYWVLIVVFCLFVCLSLHWFHSITFFNILKAQTFLTYSVHIKIGDDQWWLSKQKGCGARATGNLLPENQWLKGPQGHLCGLWPWDQRSCQACCRHHWAAGEFFLEFYFIFYCSTHIDTERQHSGNFSADLHCCNQGGTLKISVTHLPR